MSEPDGVAYPLADELAEKFSAGHDGVPWVYYLNRVYGHVFEYPGILRLTFWDKADFMGSIDGYTWQLEHWSPQRQQWQKTGASPGIYAPAELEELVRAFTAAGPSGPHWVSGTDADTAAHPSRPHNRLTLLLHARAKALQAEPGQGAPAASSERPYQPLGPRRR